MSQDGGDVQGGPPEFALHVHVGSVRTINGSADRLHSFAGASPMISNTASTARGGRVGQPSSGSIVVSEAPGPVSPGLAASGNSKACARDDRHDTRDAGMGGPTGGRGTRRSAPPTNTLALGGNCAPVVGLRPDGGLRAPRPRNPRWDASKGDRRDPNTVNTMSFREPLQVLRTLIRLRHPPVAGVESRVSAILATGIALATADLRLTVAGMTT